MNCEQYQEKLNPNLKHEKDARLTDAHVQAMLATGKARKCPRCQVSPLKSLSKNSETQLNTLQIAIQKTTGCDHMKCTHCKMDFNWSAAFRRN